MDAVPVLCLLGILCSLALAIDTTIPPEDIDGSGDDEDFSGSGSDGVFVDLESKDVTVFSTSISTLVPTVEGSTAAQEPEIVHKEGTEVEATTTPSETTKTHEDIIEDLFAVDKEVTAHEATTPPSQQTSTANLVEENDTKKHHHHHHHHPHHHNHTTTSSPSSTSESDGQDNGTTDTPLEGGEPIGFPEETTTSTPDSELDNVPLGLTTPVVDLSEYEGLLEETTSGSTSTYTDNDEAHVEPLDADLPELDSSVTTTVVSDSHTSDHPHHHHHHHHHPHHTTSSGGEADVQQEVTTSPSELIPEEPEDTYEPEDNVQEAEHTTPLADDEFPLHGHPHHETTPSPATPTEPEKPHEVHTHEPKGRRVHVPDVRSTTAIPVINEEEHIPEDSETGDSTVYYNVSRSPFDENEISDSKEEGPSGIDEDIFFEVTVPSINRMNNEDSITDDGTSNASHGIMERKELLAGIIAGGVAGLVFAAFLVAFVLYRMKKKDEGSYSLEEPKQSNGGYQKPREQREFYA